jgi:hypothetical protein
LVGIAFQAGNVMFAALHPVRLWPILASIGALEAVTMIPLALLLLSLNSRSRLAGPLTAAAIASMGAIAVISVAWAAQWLTFGKDPVSMAVFGFAWLVILGWIVVASGENWRGGSLSRIVYALAIATVLTGTLAYPVWAFSLALDLARRPQISQTQTAT